MIGILFHTPTEKSQLHTYKHTFTYILNEVVYLLITKRKKKIFLPI